MKHLLTALSILCLVACNKQSDTPDQKVTSSIITYKSDNISITNFKAEPVDNKVQVGFTTVYQKGVKSLEILRGVTSTTLCSIYKTNITADSDSALQYATEDTTSSPDLYYIVKYTLQNNDWGYTPMYKLKSH